MKMRFQTFEDRDSRGEIPARIAALRAALTKSGLTGFIVPHADRHQNEYLPASEERLAWLTGFTGSAGAAIVLQDRAVLFVDGRYTVQAKAQTDGTIFSIEHLVENPPALWLEKNLPAGGKLGYDPWLHTPENAEKLSAAAQSAGGSLVPVSQNPIDALWTDRPAPPSGSVTTHDLRYAGESSTDKIKRIRDELKKLRADALLISDPQTLAWTFNIRGGDVAHSPIALAFATVGVQGRPVVYLDARRLDNAVRHAIEVIAEVRPPEAMERDFSALKGKIVRLDQATAADAVSRLIAGAGGKVTRGPDPLAVMKAIKNSAEIAGTREAHRRDGVAMTRFLAWFEHEAAKGKLTEIRAVEALEDFRRDTGALKDVSFPTIAGAGPNGAIVHYRVTQATNRTIGINEMFLIDSGAQYLDGTTDITRTLIVGEPTAEMRDRFTRVLKGHIAIATAVFPEGTTGAQLDPLARVALWQAGLDYDHGTGHGVGSYLSVHEGPARISKLGTAPLRRGMILSNEPGYYKTGAYGIRIENLVLVVEGPQPSQGEKALNSFETLSLAPIERRLIEPGMLTEIERDWLDGYHRRVAATLSPLLDAQTQSWLAAATKPIGAN
ncbi:MAG: aminopeptidase P family protein [Pseudolabrys sp.]|nr:aminopeptidase P family protein [Pseudolabrys sp.]